MLEEGPDDAAQDRALLAAAAAGGEEEVAALLAAGARWDAQDELGVRAALYVGVGQST